MTIWEFGSSWMNSSMGLFYGIQVMRILCLAATVYFSSNGLLTFRKGWNSDNKKELRNGISFILGGVIFLCCFFRTFFYGNI
jgi:hypothetical protein